MNQKGHGQDCFQTPKFIFNQLNDIFNFNIDIACTSENKLCDNGFYFDKDINALEQSWKDKRCFCNPPFSQKSYFILKAVREVENNNCPICVMILPLLCMDTIVWHELIENKYQYEILPRRISFIDPETQKQASGNNSGTVIVYFKKKIRTKI
jgi:phage N-6-adenine-methyltransferase